jgi:hypothetical protein
MTEISITSHVCGPQCNDGTENHIWDGPEVRIGNGATASCSKCGALCIDVCMWFDGPMTAPTHPKETQR